MGGKSKSRVTKTRDRKHSVSSEITLTITSTAAQRLQDDATNAQQRLIKLSSKRIHMLEKEVSQGVTKVLQESNAERREKDQVQRSREALDWWLDAREKLGDLDPEGSVRDSLEVLHLCDLLDAKQYAESVEEGDFRAADLRGRLEGLRERWDKKRRQMLKIEGDMIELQKALGAHTGRFKQRVDRHFGRRYLMKFEED